jgi:hypothetical protein
MTLRYCQHWLDNIITNMTRGLGTYFPNQQFEWEVRHQALGLKECHSNRRPDSGTLLPTSLMLNQGEHVITNKITRYFIEPAKSYL